MAEPTARQSAGRAPPIIDLPDSPSRASTGTDAFDESLDNTLNESATNDAALTSNSHSKEDDPDKRKHQEKKNKKRGDGGINDYQIYRKFRLKMVEAFGSLGSAFYEVEREARSMLTDCKPRGEITRFDFFRVVSQKMNLFDEDETAALFAFLTNADLSDLDVTVATFKHFGVSEKQWKSVVRQKELEDEGHQTGMFSSTPQGTSTGLYLRPMHVQDATTDSVIRKQKKKLKDIGKPYPWHAPQRVWEPRIMSGDGPAANAEVICAETRGRWAQMTFSVAPIKKMEKIKTKVRPVPGPLKYPLYSLLKMPERKQDKLDENTHVMSQCPTRREEMTSMATTLPVAWWPYKSKPRTYSTRSITPR